MKKNFRIGLAILLAIFLSGCQNCSGPKPPSGEKKVNYFIQVIDTLANSPFRYYVKFNNYPDPYEITPSSEFRLSYPEGTETDSLTIKVYAMTPDNRVVDMIWYKEEVDFSKAACKDGILYRTEILTNPGRGVITPPGATTPVPIGITQPPTSRDIP